MSLLFHSKLFIGAVIALTAILFFYVIFGINPCWNHINNTIELNTPQTIIILLAFFLLSFLIAIISVLADIGGGILFTPIIMGFSSVDNTIIRKTGLIVAIFSSLISIEPFMKRGIGNLKISLLLGSCFCVGGLIGANLSIGISDGLGITGEGVIGLILVMSIPLKVACANSGVLIGIGDCVTIWPYQRSGALIPIFVATWLIGRVFGGIIGTNYLSNLKASKIRF